MEIKAKVKEFLEICNNLFDFLQEHPRIVGVAGFVVALLGFSMNNAYLYGFGSGTMLTSFLFFYRGENK